MPPRGGGGRGARCGARRRDPVSASPGVCLDGGRGRAPDGGDALVRVAPGRSPGLALGDARCPRLAGAGDLFRLPPRRRTPHPRRSACSSRGLGLQGARSGGRASSRRPWSVARGDRSRTSGSRTRAVMPSAWISRSSSAQLKRRRLSRPARLRPGTPVTSSCRRTCPRPRRGRRGRLRVRAGQPAGSATSRRMPGRSAPLLARQPPRLRKRRRPVGRTGPRPVQPPGAGPAARGPRRRRLPPPTGPGRCRSGRARASGSVNEEPTSQVAETVTITGSAAGAPRTSARPQPETDQAAGA